jgi:hypothetical protein
MKTDTSPNLRSLTLAVILIVLAGGYRVLRAAYLPELPNFSPLMAMAFCGGLFLPWRLALGSVLGTLMVSDLWIGLVLGIGGLGWHLVINYLLFSAALGFGMLLRQKAFSLRWFLGGVLFNAIVFYLVTNTGSWMANPYYAKTIAGWIQALTTGVPGYPPTWTFFRNSMFSDLFFSSIFAGSWFLARGGSKLATKARPARVAVKR